MIKIGSIGLIVMGLIHMLVLGVDVPGELPKWLAMNMWTFEHWQPVRAQPVDLALSGAVFWSTIGSLGPGLILIGAVFYHGASQGWRFPPVMGWAIFAWFVLSSAIMPPSGFPIVALFALLLAVGLQRQASQGRR